MLPIVYLSLLLTIALPNAAEAQSDLSSSPAFQSGPE
jgi:hypothetical protein